MPRSRLARLACPSLLVLAGCPNTDPSAVDMPVASGFAEESGQPGTTTESPADSTGTTTAPPDLGEPWGGTAYGGDIHAVLTVTLTPAHALVEHDVVGMAGGYRSAEVGWGDAADLYSPIAYQLAFPTPPVEPDTLVPAAPVPVFDWGDDEDWLVAGNGMKLRHSTEGSELLACLIPAGNLGQYPVYRTSAAMGVAADCSPPASAWSGAASYDLVLYGGELFTDDVVAAVVTTPAELVITAPDLSMFDAPLAADQDLAIAWEAGDDPDARIIIRVVDADTNAITVHAADDGAYTIPAAELGALTLGPLDLLVARERTDRVQWSEGGLTVLGRFERWGFFDLF